MGVTRCALGFTAGSAGSDLPEHVAVDLCCVRGASPGEATLADKMKTGLRLICVDLAKDITLWLTIGRIFAALIATYAASAILAVLIVYALVDKLADKQYKKVNAILINL